MNREDVHREFGIIRQALFNADTAFKNVDVHVGEHLKRLMRLEKTVDELYMNAMTRDRMWTCLMELLFEKKIFTKDEFDRNIDVLNGALNEAAKMKAEAVAT